MENLPEDILDLVLYQLSEEYSQGASAGFYNVNTIPHPHAQDIHQGRLVCHQWNRLLTKRLFNTITLYHTINTAARNFDSWNKLFTSKAVRGAARRVVIQTYPSGINKIHDNENWKLWSEGGEWPAFTSSIERISELDHLESVVVRFQKQCSEGRDMSYNDPDYETKKAREATLRSVHGALRRRETRQSHHSGLGISAIRELKLKNLQNCRLPSELTSGLLKGIEKLHIIIYHEHHEIDPGKTMTMELKERTEFEPYLQYSLLPPIAAQLVELTLGARRKWGLALGMFDGSNLDFPRLKTLSLSNYVIGHNTQFNWIARQKTLRCLKLIDCHIVTYMWIPQDSKEQLGLNTVAWERKSGEPFFGEGDSFIFNKKWANILDSIYEDLPELTEFNLCWKASAEHFFPTLNPTIFDSGWETRYLAFDMGVLGNHFVLSQQFGYYPDFDEEDPDAPPNITNFTNENDRRALNTLVQATENRKRK